MQLLANIITVLTKTGLEKLNFHGSDRKVERYAQAASW
jgi:hypothetical protein